MGRLIGTAPWYSRLAVALAGLSLGLALIYVDQGPGCSGRSSPDAASGWAWSATICGGAAMLLGVGVLAKRRWMAALVGLIIGGLAVLLAALTGLC